MDKIFSLILLMVVCSNVLFAQNIHTDKALIRVENDIYFQNDLLRDLDIISCANTMIGQNSILPLSSIDVQNTKRIIINRAYGKKNVDLLNSMNSIINLYKILLFYKEKIALGTIEIKVSECAIKNPKLMMLILKTEESLQQQYQSKNTIILDADIKKTKQENPTWSQNQIIKFLEQEINNQNKIEVLEFIKTIINRFTHEIYVR